MPRPLLGDGPGRARRVAVLRGSGVVVAVALGVVGVWLIVTSDTQKGTEIGILAGLWGLLIGAYCAFGSRSQHEADAPIATMPAFDPSAVPAGGGVLDLRPRNEVERKAEAAARREFQARLEKVLRREVQETIVRELSDLRAEVAALRSELVEKVGGQLRLERIETTRLIGSDLEALQQQVHELRVLQSGDEGTATLSALRIEDEVTDVEAIDVDDDLDGDDEADDEAERAEAERAEAERAEAERAEAERAEAERAEAERAEAERAEAERAEAERAEAERAEAERAEAERAEAERAEAERAEAERAEAERAEAERAEAERAEAERAEAERAEAERAEAERAEAERAEAERAEAERAEAERAEAERAEGERAAAGTAEAERMAAAQRIGGFDGDPFASMPRLSPFTDFEPVAESHAVEEAESDDAAAGGPDADTSHRGRRYREDDSEDNVLARILQRERAQ